jgi:hypothetical protein
MFKLFKRKKEDKEIIVDEQGNEVEVQDEIEQPKEEPKETVKPEGETIEEVTTDPVSEEPVVEQIPQNPVENEEVTALKIELEAMKAEIEALKKAQEVIAPSQDEWGITQEPHFNGSEPNKQPRF